MQFFHLNGSVWKMKNSRKKPVFRVLLSVTRAAFLMTTATLEDARKACQISLDTFTDEITLVNLSSDTSTNTLLMKLPELTHVKIIHKPLPDLPALDINGIYAEVEMEKNRVEKIYQRSGKRYAENETGSCLCRWRYVFSLPGRASASQKAYPGSYLLLQKTVKNLLSVSIRFLIFYYQEFDDLKDVKNECAINTFLFDK